MNTDHVSEVFPMWEGYWCSGCEKRIKNKKMWKCNLLIETPASKHKEVKYICSDCASTKEDAVKHFVGE